ncbi:hypothetical protein [Nonomuraea sp. NPDC049480]|uniref:hypothetical protein n=1 Tax=Nonomuraea sp. NPDC049480 TaxID=3364353 RepID=UPI0037B38007
MPTFKSVTTGLALGTAMSGAIVGMGTLATTSTANANATTAATVQSQRQLEQQDQDQHECQFQSRSSFQSQNQVPPFATQELEHERSNICAETGTEDEEKTEDEEEE